MQINTYSIKKSLAGLGTPYFILNFIASLLHVLCRYTPGLCTYLSGQANCELDFYECEIYFFVLCVAVIKNRRSVNAEMYFSTLFMFAKGASLILFYKMDIKLAIWYLLVCIVLVFAVKPPDFEESNEMKYFVDDSLPSVLKEDKHTIWVVEFYTTFSPHCSAIKSIYGQLSREYTHQYLKFGKCDVLKAYGVAENYGIATSALKTQLPAIVIFENGKPAARVMQTMEGKTYVMSYENLKKDLLMQQFYEKAVALCKVGVPEEKKEKKKTK